MVRLALLLSVTVAASCVAGESGVAGGGPPPSPSATSPGPAGDDPDAAAPDAELVAPPEVVEEPVPEVAPDAAPAPADAAPAPPDAATAADARSDAAPPLPPPPSPPAAGAEVIVLTTTGERVTFTRGAYTVTLTGPTRTLTDTAYGITATIVTDTWVRLLPAPFDGSVSSSWIAEQLAADAAGVPDILAIATEYFDGAPGNAGYGATTGADFNDYLGECWTYPSGTVDPPEPEDYRNLDCSGYIRMVFGYRGGLPMTISKPTSHDALPRASYQMLDWGPGVRAAQVDLAALRPGDLVFFDAGPEDGVIDHVGMFAGIDTAGHYRVMHSRNSMHGPTMRDGSGQGGELTSRSILDGTGLYARTLRGIRRL